MNATKTVLRFVLPFLPAAAMAATFHVAPTGSDDNPGGEDRPFRTIGRAAAAMGAGDTCVVHAGTYRETVRPSASGEPGRPLRFVAAPDADVILSGADPLGGWAPFRGAILSAPAGGTVEQLLLGANPLTPARHPNAATNAWQIPTLRFVPEGAAMLCPELDHPTNAWKGAALWGLSERLGWVAGTATVTGSVPGRVLMSGTRVHWYGGGAGRGFLTGTLAALDAAGEWCQQGDTVYLWPPPNAAAAGAAPAVEAVRRRWAFDLSGLRHVEIRGFRLLACSVNLDQAESCRIEDCRARWVSRWGGIRGGFNRDRNLNLNSEGVGIAVGGCRNTVRGCVVAGSAGDGITLYGASNTVENCVVHDCNLSGSDCAPVTCTGVGHAILGNTLFNGGRSILVHRHLRRGRIERNHLFNAGLLSNDLGMTYTYQTDGEGTTIAWNLVHHNFGRAPGNVGIYLDDMTRNHRVHHNIVWGVSEAMALNPPRSMGNWVFHNTLDGYNVSIGMSQSRPQDMTGSRLVNNIFVNRLPPALPNAELGTNLFHTADARFVGRADGDYRLAPDSPAVDAGAPLPGFNDAFAGRAPDIGALERGGAAWSAGSTIPPDAWDMDPAWRVSPDHRGPCYARPVAPPAPPPAPQAGARGPT